MTCIVGLVDKEHVYIAGDSAAVGGHDIGSVTSPKVFKNGKFIIGYSGSFRMGQLLRYSLDLPKQKKDQTEEDYLVSVFVPQIRKLFKDNGLDVTESGQDVTVGSLLLGYKGKLYLVNGDFSILNYSSKFYAIGSGFEVAMGALSCTEGMKPKKRLKKVMKAVKKHVSSVCDPITIIKEK